MYFSIMAFNHSYQLYSSNDITKVRLQQSNKTEYLFTDIFCFHLCFRFDRTPLIDAVENDRKDVVALLRRCGAHLNSPAKHVGQQLCK